MWHFCIFTEFHPFSPFFTHFLLISTASTPFWVDDIHRKGQGAGASFRIILHLLRISHAENFGGVHRGEGGCRGEELAPHIQAERLLGWEPWDCGWGHPQDLGQPTIHGSGLSHLRGRALHRYVWPLNGLQKVRQIRAAFPFEGGCTKIWSSKSSWPMIDLPPPPALLRVSPIGRHPTGALQTNIFTALLDKGSGNTGGCSHGVLRWVQYVQAAFFLEQSLPHTSQLHYHCGLC